MNQYGLSTNRLEALSDGVLAVAITLMVMSFADAGNSIAADPSLRSSEIFGMLCNMWPHFLSYGLTFMLVGIYCLQHHMIFHHIKYANQPLIGINFIFLMCIAILPFPADLLAECISHESNIVVLFYGLIHFLTGISLAGLWAFAVKHSMLENEISSETKIAIQKLTLVGPALYLIGMFLSFVWMPAGIAVYAIVPLVFVAPGVLNKTEGVLPVIRSGSSTSQQAT